MAAGRAGEAPSVGLTEDLVSKGFEADRLKTGTPARVDARTVAFGALEAQPGEEEDRWFSFDPEAWRPREQLCCYLTRTTAETHRLINENLLETPVYGGWVTGKGPRYCPSIEDKIVRFKDKESHQARGAAGRAQRRAPLKPPPRRGPGAALPLPLRSTESPHLTEPHPPGLPAPAAPAPRSSSSPRGAQPRSFTCRGSLPASPRGEGRARRNEQEGGARRSLAPLDGRPP